MINYDWIDLSSSDQTYRSLENMLDAEFNPREIARYLEQDLNESVKSVVIERGYVDKDYLSTHDGFYTKKTRDYRRDCVRLHFFDGSIKFDPERLDLVCESGRPEDHYFGYMVLRPTIAATLSRSLLSPSIRTGATGYAIMSKHTVQLVGYSLSVWGFPWMTQPTDIAVCAHVSCWAILRHYSERFSQFSEHLFYDVTQMAGPVDPGGIAPSLGLTVSRAERVFQAAGCYSLVASKDHIDFRIELHAYLESGFPLFVALERKLQAAVLVGFRWRDSNELDLGEPLNAWNMVDRLMMVDDNKLPYSIVSTDPEESRIAQSDYTVDDFDYFIVALPENVHFRATAVHRFSESWASLLINNFDISSEETQIRRYFMTTITELQSEVREKAAQLGHELVRSYMELKTEEYVWVVEFCSPDQWDQKTVSARVVIDATASEFDPVPLLLMHSANLACSFDRSTNAEDSSLVRFDREEGSALPRMELNLKPVLM